MFSQLRPAFVITILLTVLTGILYPLAITGMSQALFHRQADGSLIVKDGKTIGSELIAQGFTKPAYFHPRPSAAGSNGFDATASGGSNLGPTNPALGDRLKKDAAAFHKENPAFQGAIPADAITASGSGLDPDITPANAEAQMDRVMHARGMSPDQMRQLVAANTEGRQLGFLGEPRVNVLKLNLALDRGFPVKP
jgi:K+-transporting ATPase ATPase C chain